MSEQYVKKFDYLNVDYNNFQKYLLNVNEELHKTSTGSVKRMIKKVSKQRCGYKHYLEVYNKNKINYKILSKYITADHLINCINEYDNYNLKEINAAIIIQKKFRKSKIYEHFCNKTTVEGLLPLFLKNVCNELLKIS